MENASRKNTAFKTKLKYVELILSGHVTKQFVADACDVTWQCVDRWVRQYNDGNLSPKSKVNISDLEDYISENPYSSLRDIAKRFSVSTTYLSLVMKKRGIRKSWVFENQQS